MPPEVTSQVTVQMESGIPFLSDSELRNGLATTDLPPATRDAIVAESAAARLAGLRSALWLVALLIIVSLFFTGMLPRRALMAASDGSGAPPPA